MKVKWSSKHGSIGIGKRAMVEAKMPAERKCQFSRIGLFTIQCMN